MRPRGISRTTTSSSAFAASTIQNIFSKAKKSPSGDFFYLLEFPVHPLQYILLIIPVVLLLRLLRVFTEFLPQFVSIHKLLDGFFQLPGALGFDCDTDLFSLDHRFDLRQLRADDGYMRHDVLEPLVAGG